MFHSHQKHPGLLVANNFNKFLRNKKKIMLSKKLIKFEKILNTISLVYNVKQKRVWHNYYKKKCQLRTKKEMNLKQQKLRYNSVKFILSYKQRKKKTFTLQNNWYLYKENMQKKKIKLNYYKNNILTFNTNKTFYKFFLRPRLFKKNQNKVKNFQMWHVKK